MIPYSTEAFIGIDDVVYSVRNHKLIAEAPVLITIGGGIGYLKFTYGWNGTRYEVNSVSFKRDIPKHMINSIDHALILMKYF